MEKCLEMETTISLRKGRFYSRGNNLLGVMGSCYHHGIFSKLGDYVVDTESPVAVDEEFLLEVQFCFG